MLFHRLSLNEEPCRTSASSGLEKNSLDSCVIEAQRERVIVIREGKPVALVIGIDEELLELGRDHSFWKLIEQRRTQETLNREELEKSLNTD